MKKFVKAKLNDKLQDVYFLFGFKINDNFPLNDKTKNYNTLSKRKPFALA